MVSQHRTNYLFQAPNLCKTCANTLERFCMSGHSLNSIFRFSNNPSQDGNVLIFEGEYDDIGCFVVALHLKNADQHLFIKSITMFRISEEHCKNCNSATMGKNYVVEIATRHSLQLKVKGLAGLSLGLQISWASVFQLCSLFFFAIPISECSVGLKSGTHEIKRPSFPSDVFNMFEYDGPGIIHTHSWCPWIVTETSHPKKLSPGYHLRSRHQFL